MKTAKWIVATLLAVLIVVALGIEWQSKQSQVRQLWQESVSPGRLSQSHAFLEKNCAACHVPVKGIAPALCISCHADNKALLQRQPTAFHATIQRCIGCHTEHQATERMPTTMDHAMLVQAAQGEELAAKQLNAKVGMADLTALDITTVNKFLAEIPLKRIVEQETPAGSVGQITPVCEKSGDCKWSQGSVAVGLPAKHPMLTINESNLSCVSCHATKDRHQGMLGTQCMTCHTTKQWTVAEFRHPSVRSTECAQCHKPPPSHNMMHFPMMSATIARQPTAKVNQCFMCHQSTSWNDIKGIGFIKHH